MQKMDMDKGDVEMQREHSNSNELESSLSDVNSYGKSYENDVEMSDIDRKIAEIELKVVNWLKGQKNMAKAGLEEGMKLLLALDGIRKNEENRNIRKSLVKKIQSVLDIHDAFIHEMQKLTSNAGTIPTEKSPQDVNENMANSCSNDNIDVNKQARSQNDESIEVTDTMEEKSKSENDDRSRKSKKSNKDDDLIINIGEDGNEQEEVDSQDDSMEQDLVISPDTLIDTLSNFKKMKCNVLLDKKWITPGKENLLILATKSNESLNEKQPPMISAAKRRRVISKPEETEIEIEDIIHNNCEVREAVPHVIKVDPDTGEDDPSGENGNIVPIPCGACNKVLTNASTLLVHCEKHTGGKGTRFCPYLFCGYTGTRTDMLKHFRAKHTREELFQCKSCPARFTSCRNLKVHMKNVH